jgi:hypothetical protein
MVATDNEFNYMRGDLAEQGVLLNETSADEHVGEIERFIRTIKERVRATYNSLPFEKAPGKLVTEMINAAVYWWNSFPGNSGVSECLSPGEIVLRRGLDYHRHCQLEFGEYVQTHEATDNSMAPRTVGALALRPSGNAQGGHLFYSLATGKVLNRNHWTPLPMPQEVIDRVALLAGDVPPGLTFLDRLQEVIGDDPLLLDFFQDGDLAGMDLAGIGPAEELVDEEDLDFGQGNEGQESDDEEDPGYEHEEYGGDAEEDDTSEEDPDEGPADEPDAPEPAENDPAEGNLEDEFNERYGERSERYSLRPRRRVSYAHLHGTIKGRRPIAGGGIGRRGDSMASRDRMDADPESTRAGHNQRSAGAGRVTTDGGAGHNQRSASARANPASVDTHDKSGAPAHTAKAIAVVKTPETEQHHEMESQSDSGMAEQSEDALIGFVMTQVSMKRGLKMFGRKGEEAVEAELQQLHDRGVIEPVCANELSNAEKKEALAYLMFLKEKRTGKIKGRGCADGRKQRIYTTKQEASSPMVAIESILLSCVIDAEEGRHVATVDIPGAFMQADMDETVHMRLEGVMIDLLLNVAPQFGQFVTAEHGKKALYVRLAKALYGMIRAALLFYRKLLETLTGWGFHVNPYDPCVVNKTIDGKKCTILWHVDDLKISHARLQVVKDVIRKLNEVFGKEAPMTEWIGKIHDYLGMRIDYSLPGKVKISQVEYLQEVLAGLQKDMDGIAHTPAAAHLFDVNDKPDPLSPEEADFFHSSVAKLLFMCQRSRPDIQTAVAFLSSRVQAPDRDDYKKLRRVMQYIRGSLEQVRTMEADGTGLAKWWIDASFAVHPGMRGHMGGVLSLGKGATYTASRSQKTNTRSSTESELVGVYDILPQVLWTRNFLEAQGYGIKDSVLYQDNKSTILLAENGRASSSKRTRHINIRYFFITDLVKSGQVQIEHCPTQEMISDYFTKPLQGAAFRKLRRLIMNTE